MHNKPWIVCGICADKYQLLASSNYKLHFAWSPNWTLKFDIRKSVHHHTIQINQSTRCNSFTSLLLGIYMWLNMFRASPCPSSGAYHCTRSQQRSSCLSPTVKPEAPSAVICSWWWAERRLKHVEPHINAK